MILVQRLLGAVVGILFLLATLVFASVALGIAIAVGVVIWAWLWWRSRSLPRRRVVIEGEYRDVTELEQVEGPGGERR
jgi:O-antigen/teichoic acid export membrane protein